MRKLLLLLSFVVIAGIANAQIDVTATGGTLNQSYSALKLAFDAINAGTHTGTITIGVSGDVTVENTTAVLNASGSGAASYASITISPTGGVGRLIQGTVVGHLIDLNGADNVTIDGLNTGGNSLTIENLGTGATVSTVRFIGDATNNVIRNATIKGSTTSLGVVFFSTGTTTGNDGNTIQSCNITASGSNFPLNGIYSLGTSSVIDNSGNIIQQNNIFDYFHATTATSGIQLASTGNSGWTITGNKLYQTANRTFTSGTTHNGINIQTGQGYIITDNIIGYANSSGTGTTNLIGLTSGSLGGTFPSSYTTGGTANTTRYIGINCAFTAAGTVSSIQNNTIAGIALYTSSAATTTNGVLCGIAVTSGNVNIGTVTGNTIGATSGNGSLYCASTTAGGALIAGIYVTSANTVSIQNNTIGAIDAMGTTATINGGINGINTAGAGNFTITGNTIGNATANNLRTGNLTTGANLSNAGSTFGVVSGAGVINGILNGASGNIIIGSQASPNIIRNANNNSTSASATFRGINNTAGSACSIVYNTIRDITTASTNNTVASGLLAGIGIYLSGASNPIISNNTIFNLSLTNTGTGGYNLAGISYTAPATSTSITISNNSIYALSNASTSTTVTTPGTASGIFIRDGNSVNTTISNNMISLGASQTTNTTFMGIWAQWNTSVTTTLKIYHNSINIEGTVTSGAQPSLGFQRGDFSTTANTVFVIDLKNNIITNTRSGGTGVHCAIANNYGATTSSATGWAANASNYNILNGNASNIGWWTSARTFANWKSASASDNNSYSGAALTFTNSAIGDLHINMGLSANIIESHGVSGLGVSTDFDGQTRPGPAGSLNGGALSPDLGADEFDGSYTDDIPPVISYTNITNAVAGPTNRVLTSFATITDVGAGVNGTTLTRPRIYYKKSTDANAFGGNTSGDNGWKWVEASNNASVFNFTLDYTILNGGAANAGDVIQYFVVAQDLAGTPNVAASPSAGFTGTSVSAITAAPTTPNSFNIVSPLPTSINVGAGQTYTSLTANAADGLFFAINNALLSGNTTVTITSDITETGAVALTSAGMAGFTLTIQPDASPRILSGGSTTALFDINGANGVVFDGGASRNLTLRNSIGATPSATVGATVQFRGGVTSGGIRNCFVEGNASTTTIGTIVIGTGTNSGLIFSNNDIRAAANTNTNAPANAIYSNNSSNTSLTIGGASGNFGNSIYDFTSTGINLTSVGDGCVVGHASNATFGNTIYQTTARGAHTLISIGAGNGHTVAYNNLYSTAVATHTGTVTGINIAGGGNSHTINNNSIGGASANRTGTAYTTSGGFIGIQLTAGTTTPASIQANSIENIIATSTSTTSAGIFVAAGSANVGTITGNTIGGTAANDINVKNGCVGIAYGGAAGTINIENNTIRNLAHTDIDFERVAGIAVMSGSLVSSTVSGATASIKNNTISNISTSTTSSSGTGAQYVPMGIYLNVSTASNIEGNTISGISCNAVSTVTGDVHGIQIGGITNGTVLKNRISGITSTSTGTTTSAPTLYGIRITSGSATYANNQISISQSTASTQPVIRGIELAATGNNNFLFNSVYLGGTAAASNKSHAFLRNSTSGTQVIRNNIFYNERTGGTSIHGAIGTVATTGWSGNVTMNNNALIAADANKIGEWASGTDQTFAQWQASSAGDANSVSFTSVGMPSATLFTNTSTGNLAPPSFGFPGIAAGGITADYAGTTRNANYPSMGAFEATTYYGSWKSASTDIVWETNTNWVGDNGPATTTAIIIPASASFMPTLNSSPSVNRLYNLGTITISGSNNLSVAGELNNGGTISGPTATPTATLTLNGSVAQTVSLTGNISVLNFTLNNAAGATLSGAGKLNVTGLVTVTTGVLTSGGCLTLKSTSGGTARVGSVSPGAITGNVTLETFILGGRRAFRFLSHPFTTATNMGALIDNIFVTGASGMGFDNTALNNPSAFWFDNTATAPGAWTAFTHATTDNNWKQYGGARVLVRGDRTQTTTLTSGTPPPPNDVTLDVTGTLNTGNATVNLPNANNYHFVGNPYPSPLDIGTVINANSANLGGAGGQYWVWDPRGATRGQYVVKTVIGGAYSIPAGSAFFVLPTAVTNLPFTEANKTASASGSETYFRTTAQDIFEIKMLYNNYPSDNMFVRHNAAASPATEVTDGKKLMNSDMNMYTLSTTPDKLSLDSRPISNNTIIPMGFVTNELTANYAFVITDNGLTGMDIYLKDKFLNVEQKMLVNVPYNFTVSSNTASQGEARFELVFRASSPLPVSFLNIKAYQQQAGINVEWNVGTEVNVAGYDVEESTDGRTFTKATTVTATGSNNYAWFDATVNSGDNFYRIKSTDRNGTVKYSAVVNVKLGRGKNEFTVYPNPVREGKLNLQLGNVDKGQYSLRLYNSVGQEVMAQTLTHAGGSATQSITLAAGMAKGVYRLQISNGTTVTNKSVVIE